LAVTELNAIDKILRAQACGALLLLLTAGLIVAGCSRTPKLEGRVTDLAHVFSATEVERISRMLSTYEEETSHQLAVLTVPSLDGESIESFSLRVANAWGLGRKSVNNGILVTLAMRERATRIELGLGFEPYISDAKANEIMNQAMIPAFARGQFAEGVEGGLARLMDEGRKFVAPRKEVAEAAK
jgi:uncharacterized protein